MISISRSVENLENFWMFDASVHFYSVFFNADNVHRVYYFYSMETHSYFILNVLLMYYFS